MALALGAAGAVANHDARPVSALVELGNGQNSIFTHLVEADGAPEPRPWDFDTPHRLRPCCALGTELSVRVGSMPIAGLHLDNVVDPGDLGRHQYDSGIVSLENDPSHAFISPEKNGLVYTCHGGFIDSAHVRDYADWTVYLAGRLREAIDDGGTIVLPTEGGDRHVQVSAAPPEIVAKLGRQELAIRLAQWTAIQLAIWHESATWYGWSSWSLFPETASAFSPEDLYSDVVGTMLASELIRDNLGDYKAEYDEAMTAAMPEVLRRFGAAPADVTHAALRSVDGRWWDSHRPLPDKEVLLRRSFDIGPVIRPWKPPMTDTADAGNVRDFCGGEALQYPLRYQTTLEGEPLHDIVRVEVHPEPKLSRFFASLEPHKGWLSQDEFGRRSWRTAKSSAAMPIVPDPLYHSISSRGTVSSCRSRRLWSSER